MIEWFYFYEKCDTEAEQNAQSGNSDAVDIPVTVGIEPLPCSTCRVTVPNEQFGEENVCNILRF
jgi:hypothetical protein